MRKLWNIVNEYKLNSFVKNKIFITLLIAINIVLGAAIWLLAGRFYLPGIDWLICFMGYPAFVVGFMGGILYLYNHDFS